MSKLTRINITRAANDGFMVLGTREDHIVSDELLACFTSPVDLIGWLSRNLMPDAAATGSPPPPGEAKPETVQGADHPVFEAIRKHGCVVRGRLESAVLMKPKAGPEKRASTADLDQADRFARIRPARPQEGDRP